MTTDTVPYKFIPSDYQRCTKTVMDNIADPDIRFDDQGICNYYHQYFKNLPKTVADPKYGQAQLEKIIAQVKAKGKGKQYDCLIGVSGGVDSTYVALKVKQFGLRPLVVHFDNGWNSEIAVKNIENITQKLGFDLYTHVFNWEEFRDIQLAYFKANVVDIEAITDVAILGVMNLMALKFNIKYIISGSNYKTESILPKAWHFKEYVNLIDIHKKFGVKPISLFPFYDNSLKKLKLKLSSYEIIPLLDYIDYNKEQAKAEITEHLDWQDYGGKHYESVFTRFYQGYILPKKFGIDKRKAHISNLICCGELSRDEGLVELQEPIYPPGQLDQDYTFVIKKLGFTREEFQMYLDTPGQAHQNFDTEEKYWGRNSLKRSLKGFVEKFTS